MVKISILYPKTNDSRFDLDYYLHTHMPTSIGLLSTHKGFRSVSVEHGIGGDTPGSEPMYVALCHYSFDSMEDFLAAYGPHADALQKDMPNFTDVRPVIQVSAVVITK